ncbi:MAG: EF-Tu/IF-2/RF-3 family GTPase, partial [Candidatus Pacearchaeota archaeon]
SITGEGIDAFKAELLRLANEIIPKRIDTPFRMPIDSILTIKGFGTVVRGTVISGAIKIGDNIYIEPGSYKSRVRTIQSHGSNKQEGFAGERIALNLPDISRDKLDRGMMVVKEGFFTETRYMLVKLSYLPYNIRPLKSRTKCQLHIYSSRVNAELLLLGCEELQPGADGYALVNLEAPVIACYGDPFVIRGYGIYTTQGGGIVLNPSIELLSRSEYRKDYIKSIE